MRHLLFACLFALVLALPVATQEPARSSPPPADSKIVTMSGCLTGGPSSYTLSNVTVTGAAHDRPNVPVGTSGATTMSYRVRGRDGVNLAPHVGKKVEIRGYLLAPSAESTSSKREPVEKPKRDDSPDPKGDKAAAGSVSTLMSPNVAVTSVRILSASCR